MNGNFVSNSKLVLPIRLEVNKGSLRIPKASSEDTTILMLLKNTVRISPIGRVKLEEGKKSALPPTNSPYTNQSNPSTIPPYLNHPTHTHTHTRNISAPDDDDDDDGDDPRPHIARTQASSGKER